MTLTKSIFKAFLISVLMIAQVHFAYSQTASILPPAKTTFLDANGNPLTSGTVDFYIPSTTTRKTTWQDAAETIPNQNPVVLDSAGRALILGSGSYRQVVKDRNNNIIWDQVTTSAGSGGGGSGTSTGDGDLVGTIKPWAGMTAPNQYMFTYGQEVSRITYAVLMTAITSSQLVTCSSGSPVLNGLSDTSNFWIGSTVEVPCLGAGFSTVVSKTATSVTIAANANVSSNVTATFFPWGRGNGVTTFNIPDFRGFVIAGNNIMGGTSGSQLTTTYFGATNPNSSGAAGGSQNISIQLALANLPTGITSANATQAISVSSTRGDIVVSSNGTVSSNATGGSNSQLAGTIGVGIAAITSTGNNAISVTSTNTNGIPYLSSIVQPTKTSNYIIKVTPDSNSLTASGVTSLGSMTGDIACGAGLLCTGNNISVSSTAVTVGNTPINSGVTTKVLFDNAGVLGEYAISGSGNVAMTAGPTFTGTITASLANFSGAVVLGTSGSAVGSLAFQNLTSGSITFTPVTGALGSAAITIPAMTDTLAGKSLANGGTNNALTASNGGIVWSDSSKLNILAGTAIANLPLLSGSGVTPAWGAYSLPTSVTSGGVLCFTSTSVSASSVLQTANAIMLGGGAGGCPSPMGSLGTTTTVLHGNAASAPTFAAVAYADIASGAIATSAQYLAGTASELVQAGTLYQAETTTTFGATTTFDLSTFINTAVTLTNNITTQTLSNVAAGKAGTIAFVQDATGSRTTVWNSIFKWAGGTTPSLTTTANAVDILSYSCRSATFCVASLIKDVR